MGKKVISFVLILAGLALLGAAASLLPAIVEMMDNVIKASEK